MKFLIATDGTWGDVLPFSAMAEELQKNGHEVLFFANEYYQDFIAQKGMRFEQTTTARDREYLLSHKNLWNPYKGLMVLNKATRILFESSFDKILKEAKGCDAIISHSFMYSAKTSAELLGVPHIGLLFSPIQMRSLVTLPMLPGGKDPNDSRFAKSLFYTFADNVLFDPFIAGPLNKKRKALGLDKAKGLIQWGASDTFNIGLWPEWYKKTETDQQTLTAVGFPKHVEFVTQDDENLMGWILAGTPPIAVTLGSGNIFSAKLLEKIKVIADHSGERFIFITADPAAQSNNPDVHITQRVRLSQVLPQCKLFIHHGGAGSVAQATGAGIPQIILPLSHDQPDNAGHIKKNNLGCAIWKQSVTWQKMHAEIRRVTESSDIRDACVKARKEIESRPDGIVLGAQLIIEHVAKHQKISNS